MPEHTEHAYVQPTTPPTDEGDIFEIFQQDQREPFPHHGGNLRAPDNELAIHYAREFYGRRQESHKLWIIPRIALLELRTHTQLPPQLSSDVQMTDTREKAPDEQDGEQSFVVFGQKQVGHPLVWLQDLEHMRYQDAEEAARRIEGNMIRLWLCPRRAILELDNQDLLQPPLDRSYRRLDGYNIREKLRIARQRVKAQEGTPS